MRFITEFELEYPYTLDKPYAHITSSESEMGNMIGNNLGWKEKPCRGFGGKHGNRWTLEIEAFPMDKWIEFKKRFMDALPDYDSVSRMRLTNALTDLESFVIPQNKKPG